MHHLRMIMVAAAITALPIASSWAGNGSDVEPQTKNAAVPGATTSSGSSTGMSSKTTNGTGGGGMSTASGQKAGGLAKKNKVMTTGASN
ncbi:hypothetical protein ACELLULO517_17170 [Acidisoma cellulosilytica]|uniref:Uncharacterized protein n=1 Tax=Acidisoma cellulosilyticum TaxID=2802395 RepID=A0A963Z555_9PROT|nr:hypothetical protein [Acidisoma cellulosilyticum]MCB8881978.1 hypothetical protein [Acidisoma cellulosilyticum]